MYINKRSDYNNSTDIWYFKCQMLINWYLLGHMIQPFCVKYSLGFSFFFGCNTCFNGEASHLFFKMCDKLLATNINFL